jgi:hypothetical protein
MNSERMMYEGSKITKNDNYLPGAGSTQDGSMIEESG